LQINYRKVLGLIVGLSSNTRQGFNLSIKEEGDIYYLIANEKTEGDIYLTSSQSNIFEVGKLDGLSTLIGGVQYPLNIEAMLIKTKPHDFTYITYIVGSQVPAFDSWSADNYYSNSMLIFMSSSDSIKIEQESV